VKNFLVCVLFALGLLAEGCATISRGTHEDLSIDSAPSGALATLSDGQSCNTPCTLKISRSEAYIVKFSKDNCVGQSETVSTNVSGSGLTEAILLDPVFIDFFDGAIYDAYPNPVTSSLHCNLPSVATGPAPATAPPAASTSASPVVTNGSQTSGETP
jgi:hypothetical protein